MGLADEADVLSEAKELLSTARSERDDAEEWVKESRYEALQSHKASAIHNSSTKELL